MRVGIIGRGFGSYGAAPAFEATDGCQVVGVVSPRDRDQVAKLCDEVDLVSVHSPPFMHLEDVRLAVERGRAVLCDKPFGRNAEEARAMRDMAVEAGTLHFLNFQLRFLNTRARLRELVAEGAIGVPERVVMTMYIHIARRRPYAWMFDASLGGGWLRTQGSHWIDFTRWAFGEIEDITGQRDFLIGERSDDEGTVHPCTADDAFTLRLRTERSVNVVMDSTWASSVGLTPSVLVMGSEGAIEEVGIGTRIVRHTKAGPEDLFTADASANPLLDPMKTWAGLIRDAVNEGATPPGLPTFDDGLICVEAMDRVAVA
jgi:predicted dehydrogenase